MEGAVISGVLLRFNIVAGYLDSSLSSPTSSPPPVCVSLSLNNVAGEMVPTYQGGVSRQLWEHHRTNPNTTRVHERTLLSSRCHLILPRRVISGVFTVTV